MKSTFRQAAVIFGIAIIAAVLTAFFHPKRAPWYEVSDPANDRWNVSLIEAKGLVAGEEEILWIDARDRDDFEAGHFPSAILLNTAEWGDLMFQNMDRLQAGMGKPVIVYCDGSGCEKSKDVAIRLRELLGLEPVYVLKADWRELVDAESS